MMIAGKWKMMLATALGLFLLAAVAASSGWAQDIPRISKDELKAKLGDPNVVVIDVRTTPDWTSSGMRVKGAVREEPTEVEAWMAKYPKEKTIVLYCA